MPIYDATISIAANVIVEAKDEEELCQILEAMKVRAPTKSEYRQRIKEIDWISWDLEDVELAEDAPDFIVAPDRTVYHRVESDDPHRDKYVSPSGDVGYRERNADEEPREQSVVYWRELKDLAREMGGWDIRRLRNNHFCLTPLCGPEIDGTVASETLGRLRVDWPDSGVRGHWLLFGQALDSLPDPGDSRLPILELLDGRGTRDAVPDPDQAFRRPGSGKFGKASLAAEVFRSSDGFGVLGTQVGGDVVIDIDGERIHFGCFPFAEVSAAITFITPVGNTSKAIQRGFERVQKNCAGDPLGGQIALGRV